MRNKKIAVAMSGGVDSSLTAALLIERGFEVIGVTMLLESEFSERSCCNRRDIEDARAVANQLGIAHYIADFREEFKNDVEKYFVEEYLRGRTPNPCVKCNKKIKFGRLYEFAMDLGADYLATGHYARIIYEDGRFKLKKAVDVNKDQSYVLYNLSAEKLAKIILPIGEYSKAETRKFAEKYKLPVAHKPDSQEICFVPNNNYKEYLIKHADKNSNALQPGEIISVEGKILGHHQGAAFYTIGQRKGLGIVHETPLYVISTDVNSRNVIVGSNDELFSGELTAENIHWIYEPTFPAKLQAKIRYGAKVFDCEVIGDKKGVRIKFSESVLAITSGQSVVFYNEEEVLGGGIIC